MPSSPTASQKLSPSPGVDVPAVLRCQFCLFRVRRDDPLIYERVIAHVESKHPEEALPDLWSGAIVRRALQEGLAILPWPKTVEDFRRLL